MAKFEEDKIITPLHLEKAEVGKMYFYSDELLDLKDDVENDGHYEKLAEIDTDFYEPFVMELGTSYQFLYPYEEPPKQRMTNHMLSEWLAKGNGESKYKETQGALIHSIYEYYEKYEKEEIQENIVIRPFGQTDWIEPTVDIYERDCKGVK